ncbi:MAG: hypothetical protein IJJ33_08975 [Victivallales bacterium]|nr:hypothetical protein [Victivallales bacterium]
MSDIANAKQLIQSTYNSTFLEAQEQILREKKLKDHDEAERYAQKEAIKAAILQGMRQFPQMDAAVIWRFVYEAHVHRKSGINDASIIAKVIQADQSWKKSSGHAFEEMIKFLANSALNNTNIEILLQRDLNTIIKANELSNEPRDISWLKEQNRRQRL